VFCSVDDMLVRGTYGCVCRAFITKQYKGINSTHPKIVQKCTTHKSLSLALVVRDGDGRHVKYNHFFRRYDTVILCYYMLQLQLQLNWLCVIERGNDVSHHLKGQLTTNKVN
jgi:hypothetical protein